MRLTVVGAKRFAGREDHQRFVVALVETLLPIDAFAQVCRGRTGMQ